MKKIILAFTLSCLGFSAQALEITNPFYISPKGVMTSTTRVDYQKFHLQKINPKYTRYRDRNRTLSQDLTYGLSSKAALVMTLQNTWARRNYENQPLDKTDPNVAWSVGGLYDIYSRDAYYLHARVLYLQKETHHYYGAYKALQTNVKTGYDLKYFLPYTGGQIEIPIGQNKKADNNPKYDVYAGVYKACSLASMDAVLHYNYDKLYKSKKLYTHTQMDFFITPKVALGAYFDYTFFDRGKNEAEADGHTIGAQLKIQF